MCLRQKTDSREKDFDVSSSSLVYLYICIMHIIKYTRYGLLCHSLLSYPLMSNLLFLEIAHLGQRQKWYIIIQHVISESD